MQSAEEILIERAIRITPMRQLLLEYFLTKNEVVGLTRLEQIFPRADRITLFRTLKTFEEKGLLHKIENGTAEVRYALCKEHCTNFKHLDQHPHFHCLECGKIDCLETVFIPAFQLPKGYHAKEMNMLIKGTCIACN